VGEKSVAELVCERIAIVDAQPGRSEDCRRVLQEAGYPCVATADAEAAAVLARFEPPDLFLAGLEGSSAEALALLERTLCAAGDVPLIAMLTPARLPQGAQFLQQGAFDFVPWPLPSEQLICAVQRALRYRQLKLENQRLRLQLQSVFGFEQLAGHSDAMQKVLELTRRAAESEANIVISGEPGTGKTLVAGIIHRHGKHANSPIVTVDCTLRPEERLEEELFGSDGGVSTESGAGGALDAASGGTLVLDRASALPLTLQVKLLEVLQHHQILRRGALRPTAVRFRTIAATEQNLTELTRRGHFREDLYYRLNVLALHLPPLRARAGDITLLAFSFLHAASRAAGVAPRGFTPAALAALEAYRWPGNVGELKDAVERAGLLAGSSAIQLEHLPARIGASLDSLSDLESKLPSACLEHEAVEPGSASLREMKERWLNSLEDSYLRAMLEQYQGNISQVAQRAGIDRKTMYRLMKKHHLR
jgi:DNA-binding NtrC family response regulator